MKPYLHTGGNYAHFHWNLDSSVGRGGQNSNPCDVSYLQWYYALAAAHPNTPEERKVVYRKVRITGTCAGTDADPLVGAIIAHQRHLKHPQVDGRVSVARGTGFVGTSGFFILRIGARLAHMHPRAWPRLDLIPGCPPLVAQAVQNAVPFLPTD
ncbi:hypothetical protein [Pseudoxanthomonas suwonensis]|uniref:Uncharacterized protein n=1 Tax=Pseudoxanthomonas suwonensis TaxID=314722 RepID=A0A0E3ULZ1_9GAMM|nr:hypothetical protein [Pseudoxanthomonas suwonensis]AKC85916.1 hypothetical protein WQ53_03215 [Pseudoxanthomonas suwonensis]